MSQSTDTPESLIQQWRARALLGSKTGGGKRFFDAVGQALNDAADELERVLVAQAEPAAEVKDLTLTPAATCVACGGDGEWWSAQGRELAACPACEGSGQQRTIVLSAILLERTMLGRRAEWRFLALDPPPFVGSLMMEGNLPVRLSLEFRPALPFRSGSKT